MNCCLSVLYDLSWNVLCDRLCHIKITSLFVRALKEGNAEKDMPMMMMMTMMMMMMMMMMTMTTMMMMMMTTTTMMMVVVMMMMMTMMVMKKVVIQVAEERSYDGDNTELLE